ncbi:MAG: universal stress protein [Deltaproteobacteria bacterium]|nr:universal stress protein [Deltaproteobacteria bacterium]
MPEVSGTTVQAKVAVPVITRLRVGPAGSQIMAVLDDESFDLVVMGSHGRTGLRLALLGSIAEKTARHAPCLVMIARDRTS